MGVVETTCDKLLNEKIARGEYPILSIKFINYVLMFGNSMPNSILGSPGSLCRTLQGSVIYYHLVVNYHRYNN